MSNNEVNIMGISFFNSSKRSLLEDIIYPSLKDQNKQFIVTANPEIVMLARENKEYKMIIDKADYIIPDGAGIVVASKILNKPVKERIPGFEIMTEMIGYAEEKGLSCYFLGAHERVVEKFIGRIKTLHPNLLIAGYYHGFFDLADRDIVNTIKKAKPDIVFVALGSPRQEKWISTYYHEFDKGLFMGVGGSFDVVAGKVKRAPEAWIKLNLEWLYRLLQQPFRWKRILKVFEFMIRIVLRRY